jgi:ureidoglycolate hydrolase
MRRILGMVLTVGLVLALSVSAQAQIAVKDLGSVIEEGKVRFIEIRGTDASSGASVEAALENLTDTVLNINVYMAKPMFFINRGKGQNMAALQVYLSDGSYKTYGTQSFISLRPRQRENVIFIAYCANFEKDNPSTSETFTIGELPQSLKKVLTNITQYAKKYPDEDITTAAQIAVWYAMGWSSKDISEKFAFTEEDDKLAKNFLK